MDTVPVWFVEQDNMIQALMESHWHTLLVNTTNNVRSTITKMQLP